VFSDVSAAVTENGSPVYFTNTPLTCQPESNASRAALELAHFLPGPKGSSARPVTDSDWAAAGGSNSAREIEAVAGSTGLPVIQLLAADFTTESDIVCGLQPIRISPKRVLRIVDPDGKVGLTNSHCCVVADVESRPSAVLRPGSVRTWNFEII